MHTTLDSHADGRHASDAAVHLVDSTADDITFWADGCWQGLDSAKKIDQEGLAQRGWREPSLVVTERHRGTQSGQVFIGARPATRAELLAMGDGLTLAPAAALDEPALLAQRLGARRAA